MLSPEVLAEQVMGYVVWAAELIPTLKPSPDKPFSLAILPQGPHFYTWLLQAAGYLLLDNQKKKIVIISQQSHATKDILLDNTSYGPIFGQTWKNPTTKTKALASQLGAKISTEKHTSLSEQMNFQLPFLRTITESDEIIHMSIGDNIGIIKTNKVICRINKIFKEYNIVILTNIELSKPAKSKKSDEQTQIAKIIQKASVSTPLLTIFQKILSSQKKKPEIVAYVNPGDFGKTWSLTTRYICAVW